MKILMLSKALVVGAYHRKLDEIARHPDVELVAVTPPSWREGTFDRRLETRDARGYELVVSPIVANGSFHLFFFPKLAELLDQYRPDVVHVDEEPYNLATLTAVWQARRRRMPSVFFTWQNLNRRYPVPFRLVERYVYGAAAAGIAGTPAAERVLREKGYRGPVSVIPQFGVDPELFRPAGEAARETGQPFKIGFAGRLVPEKGIELLMEACAGLTFDYQLVILGQGPLLPLVRARARDLGIESNLLVEGSVRSTEMPRYLQQLDALVLPSLTRPNWAEQFGRVLVESMACGVPVVGSWSGEIPHVIGDAGLIIPEGSAEAISASLERLAREPELRLSLAVRGRERVLAQFTHARIAEQTVELYRKLVCG